MPFKTVTLTSANVPGQSNPVMLDYLSGHPVSVLVYISTTASASGTYSLQYTFDNIASGTSNAYWVGVSSAIGEAATVYNASDFGTGGARFEFVAPPAAVRLDSSALSSGPYTMKVIQGEGQG